VVSPGDTYRAAITSSHPVTTMSPGTSTPAARNVASAANASSSFAQTSPSGRCLVALSIRWVTSTPGVLGQRHPLGLRHLEAAAFERLAESGVPLGDVVRTRGVADEEQVGPAVVEQSRGELLGTRGALAADRVAPGDRRMRDQHQRYPRLAQPLNRGQVESVAMDNDPVDPTGQVTHTAAGIRVAVRDRDDDALAVLAAQRSYPISRSP
jgi:hypothetical protein